MSEVETKIEMPFGLWPSPLDAAMVSQGKSLADVRWDTGSSTLLWVESRGGTGVLVAKPKDSAVRDLTTDENVRGGVGYGGGEFDVASGLVVFAARDGRLYRRTLGSELPRPITPQFGASASPCICPDGKWVCYIHSDGENDSLAIVDSEGSHWPHQLAHSADFYMQPAWHPSGKHLAWIEWDHPNMPWDGSRLRMGDFSEGSLTADTIRDIAGEPDTPVSQPQFSPDGRWLSYIISNGEWDDLVLMDIFTGEKQVLINGEGFMLAPNAWIQGTRTYAWSHDSNSIFNVREFGGVTTLWRTNLEDGSSQKLNLDVYTHIKQLTVSTADNRLAFIATSPVVPPRVVSMTDSRISIEARSDTESIPMDRLPVPRTISWNAGDGSQVYGLYYPPSGGSYTCEGTPPAIVNIHGGPTSHATTAFKAEIVYFCSRGYAWLEVNYRGSSSYGRSYQKALYQRWGDVDVEDAVSAAQALAEQGLAHPDKIVIGGGSAGGYTVLNTLIRYPGRFKAGLCRYGVSNNFAMNLDTHKFEKYYNDTLIGTLPEASQHFHDWSAVYHADKIKDALAVFQGTDDKVVPPDQSEQIVNALKRHNIPCIYKLYEGEGHGFRKPETIRDYLQTVERFLQMQVLFTP